MNLEDDLRRALRREPAPPHFAAKILARTKAKARVAPLWRRPAALPIAAVVAVMALVPSAIYQYRQQQRAIEARNQLLTALSITRTQLQQAKERIHENMRHKR